MHMADSGKRGLSAGSIIAILLTVILTLQSENKVETLLTMSAFCALSIGLAWIVLRRVVHGSMPSE